MLARLAWLCLIAAPVLAQQRDLPTDLAEATGLRVIKVNEVQSEHSPTGRPAQPDPRRRFRGLAVFLGSPDQPVRVIRLVFADPDVALEYANGLIAPETARPGTNRSVVVRERTLVLMEGGTAELAARVVRKVWSPNAPPRSYLAIRDPDGVAVVGERRGPFAELIQRRLEAVRSSGSSRVQWRNQDKTSFVFQGPTSRVELDASRPELELVLGQSGIDGLRRRLDLLVVATSAAAPGTRAPVGPGPTPAGGSTGALGELDAILRR